MTELVCPDSGCLRTGGLLCPDHLIPMVPADQKQRRDDHRPGVTERAGHAGDGDGADDPGAPGERGPGQGGPEATRWAPPPAQCWSCGADAPAAGGATCAECALPLAPPLALKFPNGHVLVQRGERATLGRSREKSPHARLFAGQDNVSKLHATVGVDDDGGAWIRDEHSTNGTFVNGQEIRPPSTPRPLAHGDSVALGANPPAQVHMYRPA